ncbi:hypothetical protein OUO20_01960 [Arthrobacter sp. FX8]|uniref:hypothetical protein n=1 Tax=Arthrobacter sp. FX8 TaxID=2997335 RepID=UPI00227A2965|nr:hypothetical protein [Arthrobacter sp. FX8]WAJ33811.1 hypothetical protein OUO20_01960 [Arthrobacter sp. FX8]
MNGDMREEQTPVNRAVELMMQAQIDRRLVLLVEGISDFRLFNRFLAAERWELEYLEGKDNLAECARTLSEMGLTNFRVLTDRDPLDPLEIRGAVYTTFADMEADLLALEGLLERVLLSSASRRPDEQLRRCQADSWPELVHALVSPWTALRVASKQQRLELPLKDFPINSLASQKTATVSVSAVAKEAARRSRGQLTEEEARELIESLSATDLERVHNGHHLTGAIAWITSEMLDSSKISRDRVEERLRAAVDLNGLLLLASIQDLDSWAHRHRKCMWKSGHCPRCMVESSPTAA